MYYDSVQCPFGAPCPLTVGDAAVVQVGGWACVSIQLCRNGRIRELSPFDVSLFIDCVRRISLSGEICRPDPGDPENQSDVLFIQDVA